MTLIWQDVLYNSKKDVSSAKTWTQTIPILENILLPGYLSWRLPWETNNTNKRGNLLLWSEKPQAVRLQCITNHRVPFFFSYTPSLSCRVCLWFQQGGCIRCKHMASWHKQKKASIVAAWNFYLPQTAQMYPGLLNVLRLCKKQLEFSSAGHEAMCWDW